ncbi:hypothetical protein KPL71_009806 [Citrus sinensis]|uniref:Uncharacterized protein n=1 Tax=Citrus sinensis TaxID=2711 RepID=A0ACB8MGA4_CITSI|nr:hypothetical protein KPL71_009806 [Citrus sinensis]
MNSVTSASPPTTTLCSSIQSKTQASFFGNSLSSVPVIPRTLTCSSNLKLNGLGFFGGAKSPRRIPLQCNSTTKPGPPSGSGDGESRTVLDAFFLGKAVAEALNERIESAVGEFLSTVGRLQAEQQKQVQEFQPFSLEDDVCDMAIEIGSGSRKSCGVEVEDVLERAKKAKEKAAREAMEARGLVPKSRTVNATPVSAATSASPSTTNNVTPARPSEPITPDAETDPNPGDQGSSLGVSDED